MPWLSTECFNLWAHFFLLSYFYDCIAWNKLVLYNIQVLNVSLRIAGLYKVCIKCIAYIYLLFVLIIGILFILADGKPV